MKERKITNVKEAIDYILDEMSERKISRTKTEEALGLSLGLISRWKRAKTGPSIDKIFMLTRHLNIDVIFSSKNLELDDSEQIEMGSLEKTETEEQINFDNTQLLEQMILEMLKNELESDVAQLMAEVLFSERVSMKERETIQKYLNYFLVLKKFSKE